MAQAFIRNDKLQAQFAYSLMCMALDSIKYSYERVRKIHRKAFCRYRGIKQKEACIKEFEKEYGKNIKFPDFPARLEELRPEALEQLFSNYLQALLEAYHHITAAIGFYRAVKVEANKI